MDLLGSILNSMAKPPTVTDQQKILIKKQQEALQKKQDEDRLKMKKFKEDIEQKINQFLQDDSKQNLPLDPMTKVLRSVVHEIAEIAGLTAFSFGEEDIDRHIVIYKKEFVPSADELNAYRRGQVWDPEAAAKLKQQQADDGSSDEGSSTKQKRKRKNAATVPAAPSRFAEKYEHLLGKETAKEAARKTQMNKQYGFVPSANKKDQRSIEQTLADIRAKKKQKTEQ